MTTMTRPVAVAPSELHQLLRQSTRLAHHALDHHPVLAALLRPDLDVRRYGDALAVFYGIHAQTEAWILGFLATRPDLFDYQSRRKLPALHADLAALGRKPLACVQPCTIRPALGALIGALYTLEGATLGGQFIGRNVMRVSAGQWPMQFFHVYGEQTGVRWHEFLQFAEACCPPAEYALAADTAINLFGVIHRQCDHALQVGQ